MAKIVGGFADSLLTSVVRAWDPWGELDTATVNPATQGQEGTGVRRRLKKRCIMVAPASTYSLPVLFLSFLLPLPSSALRKPMMSPPLLSPFL